MGRHFSDPMGSVCPRHSGVASTTAWRPSPKPTAKSVRSTLIYAGKMDFYLNLLNDRERGPDDNPYIGIILGAKKDGCNSWLVFYLNRAHIAPRWNSFVRPPLRQISKHETRGPICNGG